MRTLGLTTGHWSHDRPRGGGNYRYASLATAGPPLAQTGQRKQASEATRRGMHSLRNQPNRQHLALIPGPPSHGYGASHGWRRGISMVQQDQHSDLMGTSRNLPSVPIAALHGARNPQMTACASLYLSAVRLALEPFASDSRGAQECPADSRRHNFDGGAPGEQAQAANAVAVDWSRLKAHKVLDV